MTVKGYKNVMPQIKLVDQHGIDVSFLTYPHLILNSENRFLKKKGGKRRLLQGHSVFPSNHQTQFQFSPSNLKKPLLFPNLENIDGPILD